MFLTYLPVPAYLYQIMLNLKYILRAAMAGKVWSFPSFWVLIDSYKNQPVKKFGDRTLGLPWLKFAVSALLLT